MRKTAPRGSFGVADSRPPWASTIERLIASGEPIPTVLITAFPDERSRERALQAGVIGYLTKPFSEDELLACIRSTLGGRRASGKGA